MLDKVLSSEKTLSDHIPFSSLVTDSIVLARNGELMTTWSVQGVPFETASDFQIDHDNEQLNAAIKMLSSDYAIYVHRCRRKIKDSLTPAQSAGFFVDRLTQRYNTYIGEQSLMLTDLYITLVYKSRFKGKVLREFNKIKQDLELNIESFKKACSQFEKSLAERFGLKKLTVYTDKDKSFSQQLTFYNYLLTGIWQRIAVSDMPLYNLLGNCQLFVASDIAQVQTADRSRYVQALELKSFCQETYAGIFNSLLYPGSEQYEFVECQSYTILSKNESMSFLKRQQAQLRSAKDAGISQTEQLTLALDELVNETISFGEYSYTALIFGDSEKDVRDATHDAFTKISQQGYTPYVSTLALSACYFSVLPGSFRFRPRVARISSKNFVEQSPLHNFPSGKRQGNPWGEAVALLRTVSDQPFYFNFHVSPKGKNNYKDLLAGHTMVLGMTGAGKTVTLNFLLAMAQKYQDDKSQKMTTLFFDKDLGAEIAVRAMNGRYLSLQAGQPTGLNPFQIENTPENQEFLVKLLKLLISRDMKAVTAYEEDQLVRAVRAVMSMPKKERRLGLIVQNLTDGTTKEEKETSLSLRLKRWVGKGELGWVFDSTHDTLDFDITTFGIDGTNILANREISGPVISYLLYRINDIKDGRKILVVIDECWQWLLDDLSQAFIKDMLKTGRKQNVVIVMATQSPSDFIQSPIAPAIIEQCGTQIFLPNLQADPSDYEKFKVTAIEYEIIRTLSQSSRKFLVKQDGKSTLCSLDLSALKEELKVLSGTTESSEKLHELFRQMHAEGIEIKPENWLPRFLKIA